MFLFDVVPAVVLLAILVEIEVVRRMMHEVRADVAEIIARQRAILKVDP